MQLVFSAKVEKEAQSFWLILSLGQILHKVLFYTFVQMISQIYQKQF